MKTHTHICTYFNMTPITVPPLMRRKAKKHFTHSEHTHTHTQKALRNIQEILLGNQSTTLLLMQATMPPSAQQDPRRVDCLSPLSGNKRRVWPHTDDDNPKRSSNHGTKVHVCVLHHILNQKRFLKRTIRSRELVKGPLISSNTAHRTPTLPLHVPRKRAKWMKVAKTPSHTQSDNSFPFRYHRRASIP